MGMTTTSTTAMTLQQALSTALAQGLARIDAQMLLLHVLGRASHDRALKSAVRVSVSLRASPPATGCTASCGGVWCADQRTSSDVPSGDSEKSSTPLRLVSSRTWRLPVSTAQTS